MQSLRHHDVIMTSSQKHQSNPLCNLWICFICTIYSDNMDIKYLIKLFHELSLLSHINESHKWVTSTMYLQAILAIVLIDTHLIGAFICMAVARFYLYLAYLKHFWTSGLISGIHGPGLNRSTSETERSMHPWFSFQTL